MGRHPEVLAGLIFFKFKFLEAALGIKIFDIVPPFGCHAEYKALVLGQADVISIGAQSIAQHLPSILLSDTLTHEGFDHPLLEGKLFDFRVRQYGH